MIFLDKNISEFSLKKSIHDLFWRFSYFFVDSNYRINFLLADKYINYDEDTKIELTQFISESLDNEYEYQ